MKSLLFVIVILGMTLTSCLESKKESYSYAEMQTFLATGQAKATKDSINIEFDNNKYRLPIVSIDGEKLGYYPSFSQGKELRYYLARP